MLSRMPRRTRTRNRPTPRRALGALVLACAIACAHAQDVPDAQLTLNMRGADIVAVLQWVAEATGRRLVVDPRVRGTLTILARDPMTPDEALAAVIDAINVYGYTAIDRDGVLRIVPAANIRTGAGQLLDALRDPQLDVPVSEVVRLDNLPADDVATALRELVPPHGHLGALAGGNSLLITDVASNVRRVARLARELDRSASLELEAIRLRHTSAIALATTLQKLLGEDAEHALQIAADEASNSLLLAGGTAQRARTRELIARLDQPEVAEGRLEVVYLHYLPAAEMAGILRAMHPAAADDAAPAAKIAVEPSESTNALVISAPPDRLDEMLAVVRKLDIRRAQVLIEAIIAEVDDATARSLGVEWRTALDGSGVEAVSRTTSGSGELELAPAGLSVGYFRNGSLRAVLRALEVDRDNSILSTPSVVALDNQEAEILVGSNVPLKTGEATAQATPADNPFVTIERQDIGVTLQVTPRINQGDAITLDILQKVESLSDAEIATDVVTDKRSIRTSVMLQDQDILVLGGLAEDRRIDTVHKVPLLGDVPLVGALFRSRGTEVERRNLMVFVSTRILADAAAAEAPTRERYERIRDLQIRHDADAPVLPPLPSAP